LFIARTCRQRHVQLGARRRAPANLGDMAGARIKRLAALVQVGNDHVGIVFEGVVHAIPVMRIDIDVRDAF